MLKTNTPVELHNGILVKREDLCTTHPDPPFSKHRGVMAHLEKRPEKIIGVLDTYHSMAGWSVAAACKELGKQCINFWPHYKDDSENSYRKTQIQSKALGAELISLQASKSAILHIRARKYLREKYGHQAYMMPNALKLQESVSQTAAEVCRTRPDSPIVVISASSGTLAAGVLRGLVNMKGIGLFKKSAFPEVFVHMGYSRPEQTVRRYLQKLAPGLKQSHVHIVDEGFSYKDMVEGFVPFPCNPYYDLKAWNWLQKQDFKNVLFWNIGA